MEKTVNPIPKNLIPYIKITEKNKFENHSVIVAENTTPRVKQLIQKPHWICKQLNDLGKSIDDFSLEIAVQIVGPLLSKL